MPCILTVVAIHQTSCQGLDNNEVLPVPVEVYNRTQYCKWPCKCPKVAPRCPLGVSVVTDGCECCKTCAKQVGGSCNERDPCDYHKGLYCDYSADTPRYEKGVCSYMIGTGCEYDGVIYSNGQEFRPSCKYNCVCVNGAIGCVSICSKIPPPRVWCHTPRRVSIPGQCCDSWVCDDAHRPRKTHPRHVAEMRSRTVEKHNNCISQSTSWSPCSKTCGRGLSMRISNDNARCQMVKESRLCVIRPCDVDITNHIKVGKKCLNIYREPLPRNLTLSGCVSTKAYWPKYCGVCEAGDERCCIPYKSRTLDVEFRCPNGALIIWKLMWINACFCNLSCQNPNDIFTHLDHFPQNSNIIN